MDSPQHERDPGGRADAAAAEELASGRRWYKDGFVFTWNPGLISDYVERKQL